MDRPPIVICCLVSEMVMVDEVAKLAGIDISGRQFGECFKCKAPIVYGQGIPETYQKMCEPCGGRTAEESGEPLEIGILPGQLEEIAKLPKINPYHPVAQLIQKLVDANRKH